MPDMFLVSFMVTEAKFGTVMARLSGQGVTDLTWKHMTNTRIKGGKVVERTPGRLQDNLIAKMIELEPKIDKAPHEFEKAHANAAMKALGSQPHSTNGILSALIKAKAIKRLKRGKYKLVVNGGK